MAPLGWRDRQHLSGGDSMKAKSVTIKLTDKQRSKLRNLTGEGHTEVRFENYNITTEPLAERTALSRRASLAKKSPMAKKAPMSSKKALAKKAPMSSKKALAKKAPMSGKKALSKKLAGRKALVSKF